MEGKIFLGLDIGTNSVGWCLTDENYHIIVKNGKCLWGIRMFDEAKSAAERRGYRSLRNRIRRRKERLNHLQEIFASEIAKVDSHFFVRLADSSYFQEDRTQKNKYTFFNDANYADYQYFKDFPTIYHLRKYLCESDQKEDIRLIYLAMHHMIKYRGNFLNPGDTIHFSSDETIKEIYAELKGKLDEFSQNFEEPLFLPELTDALFAQISQIYDNDRINDRKQQLTKLFDAKGVLKDTIVPFLIGATIHLKKVSFLELNEDKKISVEMENFAEEMEILKTQYENYEDFFVILSLCKKINDFFFLKRLMGTSEFLSEMMVQTYDKHEADLKGLKQFVKKYIPKHYDQIFRSLKEKDNYANYVGMHKENGTVYHLPHAKMDEFYAFLKKYAFKEFETTDDANLRQYLERVYRDMDNKNYLPRQNATSNGIFPYQLNQTEMKMILEKQARFYPFLTQKDENHLKTMEKIEMLLTYRVPYYIGPLKKATDEQHNHAWVIRKSHEKVYPWNFDKVIDVEQTATEFIQRMQNKCSYLFDQFCLPKNSLIFSEYDVLSFLNKININGYPISTEQKEALMDQVFKLHRKVSHKILKDYFMATYGEEVIITSSTGKALEQINCNMAAYYDFCHIFGKAYVEEHKEMIEDIIKAIVILEDKTLLHKKLKAMNLDEETIKKIKSLNYKGYGRLSKHLLTKIYANNDRGEGTSILQLMRTTNYNLMEILNLSEYQFKEQIIAHNQDQNFKDGTLKEYIDNNIITSPGAKRALIQSMKIIEELEKIINRKIDKYYVECTRENLDPKDKKRTVSRFEKVKCLLEEAKKIADLDYERLQTNFNKLNENDFQSDRYYLYFTQLGKSLYTLKPIDFDKINNNYDIDHIYPQSLIKDDSFDNRVLVEQELNREKSNHPLSKETIDQCSWFYKLLHDKGLISGKKYERLTKKEFSAADIQGFVNRQLVYTNQSVKNLIETLITFKGVNSNQIVYSKSENISSFRQTYHLLKSRTANNFHHAHDAYLNIVVGRTIDEYFKRFHFKTPEDYREANRKGITTNPIKIFDTHLQLSQSNVIWDKQTMLPQIQKTITQNFNIFTTIRQYTKEDLLHKGTIQQSAHNYEKNSGKPLESKLIPVSLNGLLKDTNKYGGLTDESFGSYAIVKTIKKKKMIFNLEAIPNRYRGDKRKYLASIYGNEFEIIVDNIKINSVFTEDKKKFCITGRSQDRYYIKNLLEKRFTYGDMITIRNIDKYLEKCKNNSSFKNNPTIIADTLVISPARSSKNQAIILSHAELDHLYQTIIAIFKKEQYDYSIICGLVQKLEQVVFTNLELTKKVSVLSELLKLLKCNERSAADLSLLGFTKNEGIMYLSKQLKPGMQLIYESVTGYYHKVVWEWKENGL